MKFAFLPNYFKKISLWCFFGSLAIFLTVIIINLLEVNEGRPSDISAYQLGLIVGASFRDAHIWLAKICTLLLMLCMAFYMLAKEKIEDDFLDVLRWESIRLSIIICLVLNILCVLSGIVLTAVGLLLVLFISYLITFNVKQVEPD